MKCRHQSKPMSGTISNDANALAIWSKNAGILVLADTTSEIRRGAGAGGYESMSNTEKTTHAPASKQTGEALSAAMDGEADDLALRRLIQESATDTALMEKWERYHLAQDLMRGRGRQVSSGFSRQVALAVDTEIAPRASSMAVINWSQQLFKLAVAAVVAVVAVVTLQPDPNESETPVITVSAENASQLPGADLLAQSLISDPEPVKAPVPVDPEAQRRLRDYIESMSFDSDETVRSEHIQKSPLYRLVNQLQTDKP
mgnify:FL=1